MTRVHRISQKFEWPSDNSTKLLNKIGGDTKKLSSSKRRREITFVVLHRSGLLLRRRERWLTLSFRHFVPAPAVAAAAAPTQLAHVGRSHSASQPRGGELCPYRWPLMFSSLLLPLSCVFWVLPFSMMSTLPLDRLCGFIVVVEVGFYV